MKIKRLLFTIVFAVSITTMIAQPKFTSVFMPQIGDATTYDLLNAGTTNFSAKGANATWDFSALTVKSAAGGKLEFMPKESLPNNLGFNQMVNSAMCLKKTKQPGAAPPTADTEEWWGFSVSADQFSAEGYHHPYFASGMNTWQNGGFTDKMEYIKYPMNFNDSVTGTFAGAAVDGLGGNCNITNGKTTVHFEGYGTLKVPGGKTYTNVVKIRFQMNATATSSFPTPKPYSITDYYWYDLSQRQPVFYYNKNYWGNVYVYNFVSGTKTDVSEINTADFRVATYPNPASEKLNVTAELKGKSNVKLQLVNTIGQVIFEYSENSANVNFIKDINVSAFPKGIYVLNITINDNVRQQKVVLE